MGCTSSSAVRVGDSVRLTKGEVSILPTYFWMTSRCNCSQNCKSNNLSPESPSSKPVFDSPNQSPVHQARKEDQAIANSQLTSSQKPAKPFNAKAFLDKDKLESEPINLTPSAFQRRVRIQESSTKQIETGNRQGM